MTSPPATLVATALLLVAADVPAAAQDTSASAPLTKITRQQGGILPAQEMALSFDHIDLAMKIIPRQQRIEGDATLTLTATAPVDTLLLDLYSRFAISAVYLDGHKLARDRYADPEGKLRIELDRPLAKGDHIEARIVYAGSPHVATRPPWDGGMVWSHTPDGTPWVGSSLWGGGCDMLWPCIDHPERKPAIADLHYTVPAPLVAPANGVFRGMTEKDGWRTYNWHAISPHTYGVIVNVGPFEVLKADYRSRFGNIIALRYWYLPGEKQPAERLFAEFPKMLDFFESYFGPYPWGDQKMGVVETPFSGMEHQTINGYGSHYAKTMYGYDTLLQHEFAHEFFANPYLGNYDDLWLHEGFASYMQPLYGQYLGGDMPYFSMLMAQRAGIENDQPLVTGRERSEQTVYDDPTGPMQDIYGKGSLVLHTLRNLIGDRAFFAATRRLIYGRPDPRPGNYTFHFRTTRDFIRLVNDETGKDYSWFFDVYLYKAALPVLESKVADGRLSLRWKAPADLPFPMPVEVMIDGVLTTLPMTDGTGSIAAPPRAAITLDPHSKILRQSDAIEAFQSWKAAQANSSAGQ